MLNELAGLTPEKFFCVDTIVPEISVIEPLVSASTAQSIGW